MGMKNIFTFLFVLLGVSCLAASPDVGLRPATSWVGTNIMSATNAAQVRDVLGMDVGAPGAIGTNLLTRPSAAEAIAVLGLSGAATNLAGWLTTADPATARAAIEVPDYSLHATNYLGAITALDQDLGDATTNESKWYASGVQGTLTAPDPDIADVEIGDVILSDGASWLRYPAVQPVQTLNDVLRTNAFTQTITDLYLETNTARAMDVATWRSATAHLFGWGSKMFASGIGNSSFTHLSFAGIQQSASATNLATTVVVFLCDTSGADDSSAPTALVAIGYHSITGSPPTLLSTPIALLDPSTLDPVRLSTNDLTDPYFVGWVIYGSAGGSTNWQADYSRTYELNPAPGDHSCTLYKSLSTGGAASCTNYASLAAWRLYSTSKLIPFGLYDVSTNSATNYTLVAGSLPASLTEEVGTATTNISLLSPRVFQTTDTNGLPLTESFQPWLLNDFSRALGCISYGGTTQAVVACVGDSWTSGRHRYVQGIRRRLSSIYGDAGGGFVNFGTDGSGLQGWTDSDDGSITVTNWTSETGTDAYGPSLTHVFADTPGAIITVSCLQTAYTNVTLHWYGDADAGHVSYSYDGFSTSNTLDCASAVGYQTTVLTPAPSTAHTLRIQLYDAGVSGCSLIGVDYRKGSTTAGSVVHKLGYSGGRATHFTGNPYWTNGLVGLNPNLITIMLGINDMSDNSPSEFADDMHNLIAQMREAIPTVPILYIGPFEVLRSGAYAYPIWDHVTTMKRQAYFDSIAWMDLSYSFGRDTNVIYLRGLYADSAHPTTQAGYLMQERIMRVLTNQ